MRRGARVLAVALTWPLLASACTAGTAENALPGCDGDSLLILAAQAVPSATLIPCIEALPEGWSYGGSHTTNGDFRFFLDSDRAGIRAVEIELTASCEVGEAVEVLPAADEVGTRRFELPISLPPAFQADRIYLFEGGCVRYRYRFASTADPTLVLEADQALGFVQRAVGVRLLEELGLHLCGAGAPPCAGETGS